MTRYAHNPTLPAEATPEPRWPMPLSAGAAEGFRLFGVVTSTNAVLREWCREDDAFITGLLRAQSADSACQPSVGMVAADMQTAGHGRLGRSWVNEPGRSFIASFVMPLPRAMVCAERSGWLTMAAGLAAQTGISEALEAVGARVANDSAHGVELKWPNDVFMAGRKLGGILTEAVQIPSDAARNRVAFIVGIGLNLLFDPDALPTPQATSLQEQYDALPDFARLRDRLGEAIVGALRREFAALLNSPAEAVEDLRRRLTSVCWTLGRPVEATLVDGSTITGVAESIAPDAALMVRRPDGAVEAIRTADVGVLPRAAAPDGANEQVVTERYGSDGRNA